MPLLPCCDVIVKVKFPWDIHYTVSDQILLIPHGESHQKQERKYGEYAADRQEYVTDYSKVFLLHLSNLLPYSFLRSLWKPRETSSTSKD